MFNDNTGLTHSFATRGTRSLLVFLIIVLSRQSRTSYAHTTVVDVQLCIDNNERSEGKDRQRRVLAEGWRDVSMCPSYYTSSNYNTSGRSPW